MQSRLHPIKAFTSGAHAKSCSLPSSATTCISCSKLWIKEQQFWRSLILQGWRWNCILLLFNGRWELVVASTRTVQILSPLCLWFFTTCLEHTLEAQWLSDTLICGADGWRKGIWGFKSYWCEHLNPSDSFKKKPKPKYLVIQSWSTGWNHKGIHSHPSGLSARPHCLPVN